MRKKLFLLFCFMLVLPLKIEAWETVSLPNQTKLIKEEEMVVSGQKRKVIQCRSNLSREEIMDFYSRFLTSLGWQEDCSECNKQREGGRLTFVKAADKITIMVVPMPLSKESKEKNDVLIVMAKTGKDEHEYWDRFDWDGSEDVFGQDLASVPRYPQSRRIYSIEKSKGKNTILVYQTTETIEEVADFYKESMGEEGWGLVKEIDLREMSEQYKELQKVKVEGKTLIFKDSNARCIISVTQHLEDKNYRVIGVKYNAK